MGSALAQTCNVLDENVEKVNLLDVTNFTAEDLWLITDPIVTLTNNDNVRLSIFEEDGGASGNFWFAQQQRVVDGFIATFQFTIDGTGDGIAFVLQNQGTENTLGGTFQNLGYRDVLTKYIGASFESCSSLTPSLPTDCSLQRVVLYKRDTGAFEEIGSGTIPVNISTGSTITAQVVYTENDQTLSAFISGEDDPIASGSLGEDLEDLLGSKFAWAGFSSSTSDSPVPFLLTANTEVRSLKIDALPSLPAVTTEVGRTVDWGSSVFFVLSNRNNCLQPVSFPPNTTIDANLTNYASVIENGLTDEEDFVEDRDIFFPTITEEEGGAFRLRFDLPFRVEASYTLRIDVDGVPAAGMPIDSAVIAQEPPPPSGLPIWGLVLLIIIIVLIVLGLAYAVVRLRRYQKKLKENEENIEAGKEKVKIDALEGDVKYTVSPLLGTLDEMREKLQENENELERLKRGKSTFDDDSTIEDLRRQNAELREEMNKLKKQQQQEEALNTNFRTEVGEAPKTEKKEYDQSRA